MRKVRKLVKVAIWPKVASCDHDFLGGQISLLVTIRRVIIFDVFETANRKAKGNFKDLTEQYSETFL